MPPGVWHAVWNLEDTVAVTHNYIARKTFEGLDAEFEGDPALMDAYFGLENIPATRAWMAAAQHQRDNE